MFCRAEQAAVQAAWTHTHGGGGRMLIEKIRCMLTSMHSQRVLMCVHSCILFMRDIRKTFSVQRA